VVVQLATATEGALASSAGHLPMDCASAPVRQEQVWEQARDDPLQEIGLRQRWRRPVGDGAIAARTVELTGFLLQGPRVDTPELVGGHGVLGAAKL
jgi:hypothetical protein